LRVFLDLMWWFRRHWLRYSAAALTLVLVDLIWLIPPQIVGRLVNDVQSHHLTQHMLILWLGVILACALSTYLLRFVWRWLLFGAAINLSTTLRERLFRHFTDQSVRFYNQRRVGDLMAHSTNDIQAIEETAMQGTMTLIDSITTGVLVIATMALTVSWQLTLVALLPMPIMAFATSRYGKWLDVTFDKAQAAFSDLNDRVQESISGTRVIKAFGQESVENRQFRELSEDVYAKNYAVAKIDALFEPTINIIVGVSFLLSIGVGGLLVARGDITLGGLTTFSMYLGQFVWPMLAFGWLFNIVERGHASYKRVTRLLATPVDVVDRPGAKNVAPTGDITWSIRTFSYPASARPALQDVNLTVARGATLGVVGRTGAGKTTLLRLLLREFDVTDGDIRIGDTSIYEVTQDGLRSCVAYVPQEHFLFSATIADNIAFGRPDADRAAVVEAAKIAAVHDDIRRFPNGYDTVVGERGVTLSGGQKQRISIARAMLLDAEILMLDDSLSAVDARTEAHILDELRARRQGRTTLIAAHRLSAVAHADVIVVIEDGRIVERGRHAQLIAQGGTYAAMHQRQQLEDLVLQGGINA
jgi:ATP-binding cassette subfamily B multidrug efflux pump